MPCHASEQGGKCVFKEKVARWIMFMSKLLLLRMGMVRCGAATGASRAISQKLFTPYVFALCVCTFSKAPIVFIARTDKWMSGDRGILSLSIFSLYINIL